MKFAFMIMGQFDPDTDRALMHGGTVQMIGVSNMDEACRTARELCDQGVDCIELCGAFEEEGARRVIEATGNKVPVGYVVHLPSQDPLFQVLFGK